MRLNRQQINNLSVWLVEELEKRHILKLKVDPAEATRFIEQAIADDLAVEDRLNEEVKEILKGYEREIEQGRADYKTMFDLVKKKLVRERGIVL